MDLNGLQKGDDYDKLPETYVIFITERDVLGHELPLYHIERTITELNDFFNDGSHMIYVNGAYHGDDDIGRLMSDFCSTSPDTMYLLHCARKAAPRTRPVARPKDELNC